MFNINLSPFKAKPTHLDRENAKLFVKLKQGNNYFSIVNTEICCSFILFCICHITKRLVKKLRTKFLKRAVVPNCTKSEYNIIALKCLLQEFSYFFRLVLKIAIHYDYPITFRFLKAAINIAMLPNVFRQVSTNYSIHVGN